MDELLIILAVIILVVMLAAFFFKRKLNALANTNIESDESILMLFDQNFDEQLKGKTILVDFWADWCMPCKMMLPVLNELADELPEGYFIGKLNVEDNQATSQKYGVRSIPTMILFKDGREVNRFVGLKNKYTLKKEILKI